MIGILCMQKRNNNKVRTDNKSTGERQRERVECTVCTYSGGANKQHASTSVERHLNMYNAQRMQSAY